MTLMHNKVPVVAIDAMGGDFAPYETVKGGIIAALELKAEIILVGNVDSILEVIKEKIQKELGLTFIVSDINEDEKTLVVKKGGTTSSITMIHAPDEVSMEEKNPARAVKRAANSSIVVSNKLVASGRADAVIAAGNTGAATAASLFELKRIEGFERPAICTIIPTTTGKMLLIDGGSNIETTPEQMVQSAIIGTLFYKLIFKKDKAKIGLLNIGEEDGKGTELYKTAFTLLKAEPRINFIGNVEGKTIIDGSLCDVAICDGFTGNIHLKALEGGLKMMSSAIQNHIKGGGPIALIGGLLLKSVNVFGKLKDHFHPNSFGGALLGGLNGISIISHGSSNYEAIVNACKRAITFTEEDLINKLKEEIAVEAAI